ncbi:MAG: DUF4349 domain-containing protein [Sporichthyaceae bacterium]
MTVPTRTAAFVLSLALGASLAACGSGGDASPVAQSPRAGLASSGGGDLAAQAPVADVPAAAAPEAAAPAAASADAATSGRAAATKKSAAVAAGAGKGSKLSVPEAALDGRVIAYTAEQTIEVLDVAKAVSQVEAAVDAAGGLIAKSERSGDATSGAANLRLRVPPGNFASFLARVEKVGTVLERATTGDDVTDEVVDVNSRIASARKSVERVRALMEQASTLRDVVALESEVASREAELEALLARQSKLEQRTELASVTLHLNTKPTEFVPPAEQAKKQGFVSGLDGGWDAFTASATGIATVLGAVLPFALVLLVLSPLLLLAYRRHRRTGRFADVETV